MSRVLIVEDETHLAKGLQFNLEAEGHSVEVVGDGERALICSSVSAKTVNGERVDGRISMPWCST